MPQRINRGFVPGGNRPSPCSSYTRVIVSGGIVQTSGSTGGTGSISSETVDTQTGPETALGQVGCVLGGNDNVIGAVFLSRVYNDATSQYDNSFIAVYYDGTPLDANYTGTISPCPGVGVNVTQSFTNDFDNTSGIINESSLLSVNSSGTYVNYIHIFNNSSVSLIFNVGSASSTLPSQGSEIEQHLGQAQNFNLDISSLPVGEVVTIVWQEVV